jgi:hypothetical protein
MKLIENLPDPRNGLTRGFATVTAILSDLSAIDSATLHGRRISTLLSLALAYTS